MTHWTALSVHGKCEKFPAKTELNWIYEVLKYGLLHGNEASLIAVVDLYCDWLSVLLPYPSHNNPDVIVRDASHMVREIQPRKIRGNLISLSDI